MEIVAMFSVASCMYFMPFDSRTLRTAGSSRAIYQAARDSLQEKGRMKGAMCDLFGKKLENHEFGEEIETEGR
jgi:hypothetical protein